MSEKLKFLDNKGVKRILNLFALGGEIATDGSMAGAVIVKEGNLTPLPPSSGTVEVPKHVNDVLAYTNHAIQGAVAIAEITEVTITETDVKSFSLKAWGGSSFQGYYFTLNAPDVATAALRLASVKGDIGARDFAMAGEQTIISTRAGTVISSIWLVAIDADGTEDNNGEIIAL